MSREMLAAAVFVWLIGALVGWFVGWVARGEQNRAWHQGLTHRLTKTRAELDEALAELDTARTSVETYRVTQPAPPAVVNVHVSSPSFPRGAGYPMLTDPTAEVRTGPPVLPPGAVSGP